MKIVKNETGNIMMILTEKGEITEKEVHSNDVDASFEKHVPQSRRVEDKVEIYVNHVMEEDHYIEWLVIDYGKEQIIKHFMPNEEPKITVEYSEGMKAYSYCNKHSLWVNEEIL